MASDRPDIDRLADTVRGLLRHRDDPYAAEGYEALDELVALARALDEWVDGAHRNRRRAEAAEARVAELETALRDIRDGSGSLPDSRIYEIARAALAGDGGGAVGEWAEDGKRTSVNPVKHTPYGDGGGA